ncbi:MAG: hypothetical protein GYA52_01755 [Chloroflexi bacterium]|nr:hypothetical protein [Chloroflexota bacterium]
MNGGERDAELCLDPHAVCITGAVMILMARQRADETMRKTNSILGWYCWWLEQ